MPARGSTARKASSSGKKRTTKRTASASAKRGQAVTKKRGPYKKLSKAEKELKAREEFASRKDEFAREVNRRFTDEQVELILREAAIAKLHGEAQRPRVKKRWKEEYGDQLQDSVLQYYLYHPTCKRRIQYWMDSYSREVLYLDHMHHFSLAQDLDKAFKEAISVGPLTKVQVVSFTDDTGVRKTELVEIHKAPDVGAALQAWDRKVALRDRIIGNDPKTGLPARGSGEAPGAPGKGQGQLTGKAGIRALMAQPVKYPHQRQNSSDAVVPLEEFVIDANDQESLVAQEGHDFVRDPFDTGITSPEERDSLYELHVQKMREWQEKGVVPEAAAKKVLEQAERRRQALEKAKKGK